MPLKNKNAGRRQTVRTVEIGAVVLKALGNLGVNASLSGVAEFVGMPTSKTHRYLKALIAGGFAEQDAATGVYRLGREALLIGLAALADIDIVGIAADYLAELSLRLNHTCNLTVWGSTGPTVVHVTEPLSRITLVTRIGSVLPLLTSAAGLVFAVFFPQEDTKIMIHAETAELMRSAALGKNPHAMLDERLRSVRINGIATVHSLYFSGVDAIAAPVFGPGRRLEAAITALGPTTHFDLALTGNVAQSVIATATAISAHMGYVEK